MRPNDPSKQRDREHFARNSRIESTPDGRALNLSAICLKYRITASLFYNRQRKGWPSLNGEKIKPYQTRETRRLRLSPIAGGGGLGENLYLEADLERGLGEKRLRAPGSKRLPKEWLNDFTYTDTEGDWLTARGTGLSHVSLLRWSTDVGCRFLDKRRSIRWKKVPHPNPRRWDDVTVYSRKDIDTIKARRRPHVDTDTEPYRDEAGQVYLTNRQLRKKYGVSESWVRYWWRERSRLHEGYALRSMSIPNRVLQKGSPSRVWAFLEEDVARCIRGEEGGVAGGASWTTTRRQKDHDKTVEFLRNTLRRGPVQSREIYLLAQDSGITRWMLCRAKKELSVVNIGIGNRYQWYWWLPGTSKERQAQTRARKAGRPKLASAGGEKRGKGSNVKSWTERQSDLALVEDWERFKTGFSDRATYLSFRRNRDLPASLNEIRKLIEKHYRWEDRLLEMYESKGRLITDDAFIQASAPGMTKQELRYVLRRARQR